MIISLNTVNSIKVSESLTEKSNLKNTSSNANKLQLQNKSSNSNNNSNQDRENLEDQNKYKNSNSNSNNSNNSNKGKQDFFPGDPCPCASQIPQCCTPDFEVFSCDCIVKPDCGICQVDNLNVFSNFHDSMLKMAMKDAFNQQDLAQKAKLQVELFQKAQDFAKEVGIQEMKAKQYARILNEATRKAQISRAMMFQAASQVRYLADKTLKAITPMRCSGPRCGAALTQVALSGPNYPNQALMTIKQKINDLGDLTNPTMSKYGSYGNGDYSAMRDGYLKNSSYNGNSRETAYSGSGSGYNTYGVSAN